MKKIATILATAASLVALSSCGGGSIGGTAKLTTAADSAAYALGVANANYMYQQIENTPDSLKPNVDEIIKGMGKASSYSKDFIQGLSIAKQFEEGIAKLNEDYPRQKLELSLLLNGFAEILKGKDGQISKEEAQTYFQNYLQKVESESLQPEIDADNAYMEELKKDADVKVTESGLMYKVTELGTGATPTLNDTVVAHYKGYQRGKEGKPFDSSYDRGEPAEFPLSSVIKGWQDGFQLMPEGSKFILYIPAELGYGQRTSMTSGSPQGLIIFECELVKVKPAAK